MKAAAILLLNLLAASNARGIELRVNGVPMQIERQVLPGTANVLADELERRWRRVAPGALVVREQAADSILLSRQIGAWHQSLRLKPLDGADRIEVLASDTDLARTVMRVPQPPLALPATARLQSVVESGAHGRTISFVGRCQHSVAAFSGLMSAAAQRSAWRLLPRERLADDMSLHWWIRGREALALRAWADRRGCQFVLLHETARSTTQ